MIGFRDSNYLISLLIYIYSLVSIKDLNFSLEFFYTLAVEGFVGLYLTSPPVNCKERLSHRTYTRNVTPRIAEISSCV